MNVDRQANLADLVAKYTRPRTPTVLELGRTALGNDLANGYTTATEADELGELLGLSEGGMLLDLGSGRAWPGLPIATSAGCRLFATDLTLTAVRAAQGVLEERGASVRAFALPANGTALPFRSRIFNAVIHADVLC